MRSTRCFPSIQKHNFCVLLSGSFTFILILFLSRISTAQTLNIKKQNCHLSKEDTATIDKIARYEAAFYNAVFETAKNDSLNINIYVFGRKADFKETPDGENALHVSGDGYYWEKTGAVYLLKTDHVNEALLHEISHVFLHYNFNQPPKWFDEGLATYFGSLIVEDKQIFYTPVVGRIERIKELVSNRSLNLEDFLNNNNRNWGDDINRITDKYTVAYSIIYFLVKTNLNLVKQLADGLKAGKPSSTVLAECFGSMGDFESRFSGFYKQQN